MSLEIFHCEKRNLTLSTAGCSKLYVSANGVKPPEPYEGRAACRACTLGAYHATGRVPDPSDAVREQLRGRCSRCGKKSFRIINATITGHCDSCYNRHREVIKEKNAKGTVPGLTRLLHTEQAMVTSGDDHSLLTRHLVLGFEELVTQAKKTATTALTFVRWIALDGRNESGNHGTGMLSDAMPANDGGWWERTVGSGPVKLWAPRKHYPSGGHRRRSRG